MTKTASDKVDLWTALKNLAVRLPAGRDGRRNRRALARRAAIVTLAAIAALAMPTACSKAPQKAQFKDATITLYMDLQSGKYVPDSTQATVLKVTDQKQLEALLAFFPEMDRGKESWRAAGWEAGVEIKFARPDGKTIRVSVSSNDDLTIWSEGHGDWPVNGDLKAFLLDLQKGQAATQPAAQMVLHIVSAAEWQRARQAGSYEPTSLGSGDFVHCSTPEQIIRVANANFRGKSGLVLLCINPKRLKAPVMYENLEGGTSLFPHIYGPVNLEAVVEVLDFAPQQDGTFLLPAKLVAVPSASSGPAPEAARRPAAPWPATQPAQGPVQTDWSAPREGVQMRLRAARKTWRADEIPALRWDVRNVGTRKFLAVGDGQRLAQLEVDGVWHQWPTGLRSARLADMGAGAWLEDQLVTASPIWSQAKPEDLEWRMDGGGKIVLSGEESPPSLQFKPGTYTIRLAAVIQPSRVDTGDGFRVVSEPMDITIEALPAGQTASWPPGPKLAQAVKKALYRAEIPLTNTPRPGQPEMKDWIAGALAKAKQAATLAEKTPLHASASRLADAFVALQQAVDKDPAGAAKEFSAAWTAYGGLVDVLAGITSPATQPAHHGAGTPAGTDKPARSIDSRQATTAPAITGAAAIQDVIRMLDLPWQEKITDKAWDKAAASIRPVADEAIATIMMEFNASRVNAFLFRHRAVMVLERLATPKAKAALIDIALGLTAADLPSLKQWAASSYVRTLADKTEARVLLPSDDAGVLNIALLAIQGIRLDRPIMERLVAVLSRADKEPHTRLMLIRVVGLVMAADPGSEFAKEKVDAILAAAGLTPDMPDAGELPVILSGIRLTFAEIHQGDCLNCLSRMKNADAPLREAVGRTAGLSRDIACIALAMRGDASMRPEMRRILQDDTAGLLRKWAAEGLGPVGTSQDVPLLKRLAESDPLEREAVHDVGPPDMTGRKVYLVREAARLAIELLSKKPPATAPATVGASTQPAEMVITPGVGVGPVTLGMSREEVIKHLGKPVKIEGEGGYGLNYISSMGLSVLVSPRKGVVSISCWTSRVMYWLSALGMKDFRGATDKGIKMGAGRDEIVRAYGRADSESGGAPLYMDYRSEGIKFILCSGKLAQIEVVEPDVFALIPSAAFSQPAATTQPATQPATQPGG